MSPAGNVSPTVIALCAGLVPLLVSVKMRLVLPPSVMLAAPKVLATVGLVLVTVRHWSTAVLVALVAVTLAPRLVCAATGQVPVCPAVLLRPATVTVQLTVPLAIARPVSPLRIRLPLL